MGTKMPKWDKYQINLLIRSLTITEPRVNATTLRVLTRRLDFSAATCGGQAEAAGERMPMARHALRQQQWQQQQWLQWPRQQQQ